MCAYSDPMFIFQAATIFVVAIIESLTQPAYLDWITAQAAFDPFGFLAKFWLMCQDVWR